MRRASADARGGIRISNPDPEVRARSGCVVTWRPDLIWDFLGAPLPPEVIRRLQRAAVWLFRAARLPTQPAGGHQHRMYAAQVILYVEVFGIIAAIVPKRIRGG
jgi:hypothetical protein